MNKSLKILLVEDDIIEVMKFNRAVLTLNLPHKIITACNGEEGLEVLEDKDQLPNIIFLDLNMPKINGIEFLTILKDNPDLRHIPVVVLSTSNNKRDLLECYKIGVSGYVLKPLKYGDYLNKINKMMEYWSVNQLIAV